MPGGERLGFSGLTPNEVVGMFVMARMKGLELTPRDVARNIDIPVTDVRKMLEGELDFKGVMTNLPAIENYLEFEAGELVRLYLKRILGE
jgi:predicted transcriptional regulator